MNTTFFDWHNRDPLFDEVAHYVVERQAVSASAIGDKFSIGTNRAKRIIKQLEQAYIIGEKWSSMHPRTIYFCCARKFERKLADLATIARLQPLEDKWQAERAEYEAKERAEEGEEYFFKIANNRPLAKEVREREEARARFEAMTEEERQAESERLDKEWEEKDKNWGKGPVHGMERKDWNAYRSALDRQKYDMIMRECPWGEDYDWSDIFQILKFKIERMIEYWEQFGHCRNGHYVVSTMRTACCLINIVLKYGNECNDCEKFPYRVNLRNADRFKIYHDHNGYYDKGDMQKVRYNKAYCILFKYLEFHLHNWWD
ncbi:MAG: hypothetical protein IJF01_04205 [Tidjanibacter sp.]|nr:hypothetical protein [Tidjanibacter sp.]